MLDQWKKLKSQKDNGIQLLDVFVDSNKIIQQWQNGWGMLVLCMLFAIAEQ